MSAYELEIVVKRRIFSKEPRMGLKEHKSGQFILPLRYRRILLHDDKYVLAQTKKGNIERYSLKEIEGNLFLEDRDSKHTYRRGNDVRWLFLLYPPSASYIKVEQRLKERC